MTSPPRDDSGDGADSGEYGGFDYAHWMDGADNGELDVYTCLALSDGMTWSADTQKLVAKIVSALVMQISIPALVLMAEIEQMHSGISFRPASAALKFRVIGFTMMLYALWSMHDNALDECRSAFMVLAIDQRMTCGYIWPLVLGEFVNIVVAGILLLTMYFCFSSTEDELELVLNAVAFNFLGGVDAEFVDRQSYTDAVQNFQDIMAPLKDMPKTESDLHWVTLVVEAVLKLLRIFFVIIGITLAMAFLCLPDDSGETPWEFLESDGAMWQAINATFSQWE